MSVFLFVFCSLLTACHGVDNHTQVVIPSELPPPKPFASRLLQKRDLGYYYYQNYRNPDNDIDVPTPTISTAPSVSSQPTMTPTIYVAPAPTQPPVAPTPTKPPIEPETEPPMTAPPTPEPTEAPTSAPTAAPHFTPIGGLIDATTSHPTASIAGFFALPILAIGALYWAMQHNTKAVTTNETLDGQEAGVVPERVVSTAPSTGVEMINSSRFGRSQTIMAVPSVDELSTEYVVMGGVNV